MNNFKEIYTDEVSYVIDDMRFIRKEIIEIFEDTNHPGIYNYNRIGETREFRPPFSNRILILSKNTPLYIKEDIKYNFHNNTKNYTRYNIEYGLIVNSLIPILDFLSLKMPFFSKIKKEDYDLLDNIPGIYVNCEDLFKYEDIYYESDPTHIFNKLDYKIRSSFEIFKNNKFTIDDTIGRICTLYNNDEYVLSESLMYYIILNPYSGKITYGLNKRNGRTCAEHEVRCMKPRLYDKALEHIETIIKNRLDVRTKSKLLKYK